MDIREEDGIPVFDINDTGKRVFDLVMRFGTSQSPKRTRSSTAY
jgi:hypothetical protein